MTLDHLEAVHLPKSPVPDITALTMIRIALHRWRKALLKNGWIDGDTATHPKAVEAPESSVHEWYIMQLMGNHGKLLARFRRKWGRRPGPISNAFAYIDLYLRNGRKRSNPTALAECLTVPTVMEGDLELPFPTFVNALDREIEEYARPRADTRLGERRRRPTLDSKIPPLTPRQIEVVQIVGEHKGNIAAAAKQMGVDRKTAEEHYRAGLRKLGRAGWQLRTRRGRFKTQKLPQDKRGQPLI